VAPDGIDLERYGDQPGKDEARKRLGIDPGAFVAGFSGHMYPGRGIDRIFDIALRMPDVVFYLMGGMEEHIEENRRIMKNRGIENIVFTGFVVNSELPLYQAASDVLLMPYQRRVAAVSTADIASFFSPMKMFEYMAANRLIVSSDLPVLREILDETNAVLCPPDDTEAWCEAINRARNDPSWAEKIAEKARSDVERYTWRNRVRRILSSIDA